MGQTYTQLSTHEAIVHDPCETNVKSPMTYLMDNYIAAPELFSIAYSGCQSEVYHFGNNLFS